MLGNNKLKLGNRNLVLLVVGQNRINQKQSALSRMGIGLVTLLQGLRRVHLAQAELERAEWFSSAGWEIQTSPREG